MQALERSNPTLEMKPEKTECSEFEYIRHGTQCLTANLEVATGKIISPTVADTRKEDDFVEHISKTIETDKDAGWIFILDQLNTHKSASLVEFVAKTCQIDEELGEKGISGVLKTMEDRQKFLENPEHRIRFVYTPKHCSWLNQVEIFFSKLAKRILIRGNFTSKEDLKGKTLRFIEKHNTQTKPYKWNCDAEKIVEKIKTALDSIGSGI